MNREPLPGQRELYGGIPPFEAASETSHAAAVAVMDTADTKRARVLSWIQRSGSYGATADEIETAINMIGNTVRPRIRELYLLGHIVRKARDGKQVTRPTRSGKQAVVWVVP